MLRYWIICGFLFLASGFGGNDGVQIYDDIVSEQRDHSVLLTCPIDVASCGELHSVKWFKGSVRIAVVSGDGELANVKEEYMSRMSIDHSPKGPSTHLSIRSLQITDEDIYTCESTFLEPLETCDTSGAYRIELKVEVPPSGIHLLTDEGKFIKNGSKVGPFREGNTFKPICEVTDTRPSPTIGWYRGGRQLLDTVEVNEVNGLFSVKSVLSLILSRQDLGTKIECRVESQSLENSISNFLEINLEVRPTSISLTGLKHHAVEDSEVILTCKVIGARPPVNITWYNSTIVLDVHDKTRTNIQTKTYLQNDGTFDTISTMLFTASRYENDAAIRCEADNVVMRDDREKPIHDNLVLEVLYPPVVIVKPDNVTANETEDLLLYCTYVSNPASLENVKWFRNGDEIYLNQTRYEGGNAEYTSLVIKNASRQDNGLYTCKLTNSVGYGISNNEISVDILFPPIVNLTMEPDTPVIEDDQANVTLYCNVLHGNPTTLLKVRWFLEGALLKELPECNTNSNSDGEDLCNVDPSKLLLQDIGREFLGNYSCEGLNVAGWGPRSEENDLIVHYEPGNASLIHHPLIAIKKKSVTFSCTVEDSGYPNITKYHWLRGGRPVMDIVSAIWTVDPVGLDSRTNFSCYAQNIAGNGNLATIELDVHAPPAFIQKMLPYSGVLYSKKNASLTCRIECVPKCTISWFKDGIGIAENSNRYIITEKYLPAEPATGDFESVLSVLYFNMSAWPREQFDIYNDNGNYSCVSSENSVGSGVRSLTYLSVEYPPENTTVSNTDVTVIENQLPERMICTAKGNPEPTYEWRYKDQVIGLSSALLISTPMTKQDGGVYHCQARNKHGVHSAKVNVNIFYPPTCDIIRKEIDDQDTLICTTMGNPEQADFVWYQKLDNYTHELSGGRVEGLSSYFILTDDISLTKIYKCMANNTVGSGPFCEIEVAGHVAWWKSWNRTTQIILIATILAILVVIILCCIIICICRRRRRQDKLHGKSSALGDPLTEPGEYENLPFHGLQTAPNKHHGFDSIYNRSDTYIY